MEYKGQGRQVLAGCVLPFQEDELELVLSKTPEPWESSEAVLVGKQLYFPQQETDVDLLKLLQPYKDVQV